MYDINCSLIITVTGITLVGRKVVALFATGVTSLAGAVALGFWNGYNDTKRK